MLKNYLKIAWRNLTRNKAYSILNIAGLVIGFAACLLIGLYLHHELSYDEFHKKAERIYRLNIKYSDLAASPLLPAGAVPAIAQRYPEIVNFVRVYHSSEIITSGREPIKEKAFYYADASFFDIFSFHLIKGNPEKALTQPNSVVLTKETARQYFSKGDAMGKTLTLSDGKVLRITGILENIPSNSHLQFDFLASFSTLPTPRGFQRQSLTYLLLNQPSDKENFGAKLADALSSQSEEEWDSVVNWLGFNVKGMEMGLQPITAIHLNPFFGGLIQPENNFRTLYIFGCIALFVLLLACINYVNLATACAAQRTKEVGMRKTVGAKRSQLLQQFLGEAVLTTFIAGILALVLARFMLPVFNALIGMDLSFVYTDNLSFLVLIFGVVLVIGLISGSYPALVLSRFEPATIMNGSKDRLFGGVILRKGLVAFQFTISIVIVAGTLIAYSQLRYMNNIPLGYQTEDIIYISLTDDMLNRAETIKKEFLKIPGVENASLAQGTPMSYIMSGVEYKGREIQVKYMPADADYIETMGIKLIAGSGLEGQFAADSIVAVVVNETAARIFDLYDDIGEPLPVDLAYGERRLVGIVRDFHSESLHEPIGPVAIYSRPARHDVLLLRLDHSEISATLSKLEQT